MAKLAALYPSSRLHIQNNVYLNIKLGFKTCVNVGVFHHSNEGNHRSTQIKPCLSNECLYYIQQDPADIT